MDTILKTVDELLALDIRAIKPNIANAPIIEFLIVSFIVLILVNYEFRKKLA